MRILCFSKKWGKLNKQWFSPNLLTFTTFRFPRRDRDWEVEEVVQPIVRLERPSPLRTQERRKQREDLVEVALREARHPEHDPGNTEPVNEHPRLRG